MNEIGTQLKQKSSAILKYEMLGHWHFQVYRKSKKEEWKLFFKGFERESTKIQIKEWALKERHKDRPAGAPPEGPQWFGEIMPNEQNFIKYSSIELNSQVRAAGFIWNCGGASPVVIPILYFFIEINVTMPKSVWFAEHEVSKKVFRAI